MNRVAKIEVLYHSSNIRCIVIHIVSIAYLGGATVAASVMRDDSEALAEEEQHLGVPVIAAEGPSMMEYERLRAFRTPVLVENRSTIFRRDVFAIGPMSGTLGGLLGSRRAGGNCRCGGGNTQCACHHVSPRRRGGTQVHVHLLFKEILENKPCKSEDLNFIDLQIRRLTVPIDTIGCSYTFVSYT